MRAVYHYVFICSLLIVSSCNQNNSEASNYKDQTVSNRETGSYNNHKTQPSEESSSDATIDGTYRYSDSSTELSISIYGTSWYGKTTIKSGYGQEYDSQNAQSDSGIIKGNDLYDSSGMVKIGYVDGRNLTTSIGGNNVTLSK
jgi:hypothetical protein